MAFDAAKALVEAELTKLSHDFAFYMDYRFYEALAGLFLPDGVFHRALVKHSGREEILAGMQARPPMATRHLLSNFHFSHASDDEVRGCVYAQVYTIHLSEADEAPVAYQEPPILLDFHDRFRRTPDGWRFAERVSRALMVEPGSTMLSKATRWQPHGF